jgi:hypothetical protein
VSCSPQKDTAAGRQQRQAQIHKAQQEYIPVTDGPLKPDRSGPAPTTRVFPYLHDLPFQESQFGAPRDNLLHLTKIGLKLVLFRLVCLLRLIRSAWMSRLSGRTPAPFSVYKALYGSEQAAPAVDDRWRSDYEYGYQKSNAMSPVLLHRLNTLPAHMPGLTDAAVAGLLPPNKTLQHMLDAGRLFCIDNSFLLGCPHHKNRTMTAPTTVFLATAATAPPDERAPALAGEVVPAGDLLRPIAIQLLPDPNQAQLVTPTSPMAGLWLVTRMHAGVADLAVQVFFEHMVTMHQLNETFWIYQCRTMADRHPLKVLMAPHMHATLSMGKTFREGTYMHRQGSLPTLHACGVDGAYWIMEKRLETWKFTDHDLRRFYRDRGLEDLPGSVFRDDTKRHFTLIFDYVKTVVEAYYPTPEDISGDVELQAFVRALGTEGRVPGLPGKEGAIGTAEEVTLLFAIPIYAGAVRHSAIDVGSFDFYGFAPNSPLSFFIEPPLGPETTRTGGYSDADIDAGLPKGHLAALQVALVLAAQNPTTAGLMDFQFSSVIGHNGATWAGNGIPVMAEANKQWRAGLAELKADIEARNQSLQPRAWGYLHPDITSNSVWF